jgi:hypothetical protein
MVTAPVHGQQFQLAPGEGLFSPPPPRHGAPPPPPPPMPAAHAPTQQVGDDGWYMVMNENSRSKDDSVYYVNGITGETSWKRPGDSFAYTAKEGRAITLAAGWVEVSNPGGVPGEKVYVLEQGEEKRRELGGGSWERERAGRERA